MARSPHGRPAGVSAFQAIRRSRHSSSANLVCSFFRDFTLGILRAFRQIYGMSQYWSQVSYMAMIKDTGRGIATRRKFTTFVQGNAISGTSEGG